MKKFIIYNSILINFLKLQNLNGKENSKKKNIYSILKTI